MEGTSDVNVVEAVGSERIQQIHSQGSRHGARHSGKSQNQKVFEGEAAPVLCTRMDQNSRTMSKKKGHKPEST